MSLNVTVTQNNNVLIRLNFCTRVDVDRKGVLFRENAISFVHLLR